jgi:hypothetical protein
MQPNTSGYTLLAYARPPVKLPAAKWQLLVVGDRPLENFITAPLTEARAFTGNDR